MENERMKYQLRRMVLVNAGTNMHVPSGRITAVDPRGGATVLGENGVGKTTTLRILPLFFGHLPSQIITAGHGQEAMVRFVLPTDASAIAFEYQRGSDGDDDLRLAVIRRRGDDPDAPFYRFYRCGFRPELFIESNRFLSDDETQLKVTELGIPTTSKLTTAEYRSVILRSPATSKEREKLRRYSLDYSFSPRQLDNLDDALSGTGLSGSDENKAIPQAEVDDRDDEQDDLVEQAAHSGLASELRGKHDGAVVEHLFAV